MSLFFRLFSWINAAKQAKTSLKNAQESARKFQDAARSAQATVVNRSYAKAEQGNAAAQFDMGERYFEGLGVPRDYAIAAQWFEMAAIRGHAHAQCNLGMMYFLGRGVARDYAEAYKWIELAARQGYAGATKARGAALRRMSPEQVEEGKLRISAMIENRNPAIEIPAASPRRTEQGVAPEGYEI